MLVHDHVTPRPSGHHNAFRRIWGRHGLLTRKSVNYVPCHLHGSFLWGCSPPFPCPSPCRPPTPPHHTLGSPHPENVPIAIPARWLICTCHWPTNSLRISNMFHESITRHRMYIYKLCLKWINIELFPQRLCISTGNDGLFTFCISLGPFPMWNMNYYMATRAWVSTVRPLVILQPTQQQGPWAQWHGTLVCRSGCFLTYLSECLSLFCWVGHGGGSRLAPWATTQWGGGGTAS